MYIPEPPPLPPSPLATSLEDSLFSSYATATAVAPYAAGVGAALEKCCANRGWKRSTFDLDRFSGSPDQAARDLWELLGGRDWVTLGSLGERLYAPPWRKVVLRLKMGWQWPLKPGAAALLQRVVSEYLFYDGLPTHLRFVFTATSQRVMDQAKAMGEHTRWGYNRLTPSSYNSQYGFYDKKTTWELKEKGLKEWWGSDTRRRPLEVPLSELYRQLGGHPMLWALLARQVEREGWGGWEAGTWLAPLYDLWTGLLLEQSRVRRLVGDLLEGDSEIQNKVAPEVWSPVEASGILNEQGRVRPIVVGYLQRRLGGRSR